MSLTIMLPTLPVRRPDSNKGDFGRVLIVAGSRGMSGAAILCASTALRGGAGLVRVAIPAEILPIVAAGNPCYITIPLPQDADGHASAEAEAVLLAQAHGNDVVAVGPGLGNTPGVAKLVAALLQNTRGALVLDADALNVLVGRTESLRGRSVPPILTPHPGEFARLIGSTVAVVQGNRRELAERFATDHGVVLVLKGHESVITDGRRTAINTTGNPGMATGGSGDVLTGLLAALLGQKLAPFEAAQLGAHLHGLAGDLAFADLGAQSLMATDLIAYLPAAFRRVTQATTPK